MAGFSFLDHPLDSKQNRNPKAELQMWAHITEVGSNGLSFGSQDLAEAQGLPCPGRPSPSPSALAKLVHANLMGGRG